LSKKAKPTNSKRIARGLLFAVVTLALILAVVPVSAFQGEGPLRREVELVKGHAYDVSIGNGGIFIDEAAYINSTLVLRAEQFPRKFGNTWHQFTQRIIDFQIYDRNGDPFEWVYGNVRIYFNLDKLQYDKWVDEEANMSIWYFAQPEGGWRKCPTHWEATPGVVKGRLWCLARFYTRYGLAWTQPTITMKLIKLGVITITPTPGPTKTPTPTSSP
jgi:hypothetical protein